MSEQLRRKLISLSNWAAVLYLAGAFLLTYLPAPESLYLIPGESNPWYSWLASPLVHVSLDHLLGNLAALLPALVVVGFTEPRRWGVTIFLLCLSTSAMVWWLGAEAIHVGLSGVVIALSFYGVLANLFTLTARSILLAAGLVGIQIFIFTQFFQAQNGVSQDAHICGAISGLALSVVVYFPRLQAPARLG